MILCMCDASARHVGSGLRDVAPPLCGVGGRWDLPLLLGYDVQGHPCKLRPCRPTEFLGRLRTLWIVRAYMRVGVCCMACAVVCVGCICVKCVPTQPPKNVVAPNIFSQLTFFLPLAPQALTQRVVAYRKINICSSGAVCCDFV